MSILFFASYFLLLIVQAEGISNYPTRNPTSKNSNKPAPATESTSKPVFTSSKPTNKPVAFSFINPTTSPTIMPALLFDPNQAFLIKSFLFDGFCLQSPSISRPTTGILLQPCQPSFDSQKFKVVTIYNQIQLLANPNFCLDSNSNTLILNTCSQTSFTQAFNYDESNRILKITPQTSDICVDIGLSQNSVLHMITCSGTQSQQWTLVNLYSNKPTARPTAGLSYTPSKKPSVVYVEPSIQPTHQPMAFRLGSIAPSSSLPTMSPAAFVFNPYLPFIFKSVQYPGYCLQTDILSTGGIISTSLCQPTLDSQKFIVNAFDQIQLYINIKLCFTLSQINTGGSITLQPCNGVFNQTMAFQYDEATMRLIFSSNTLCVDDNSKVGSNVVMNICGKQYHQKWTLVNVDGSNPTSTPSLPPSPLPFNPYKPFIIKLTKYPTYCMDASNAVAIRSTSCASYNVFQIFFVQDSLIKLVSQPTLCLSAVAASTTSVPLTLKACDNNNPQQTFNYDLSSYALTQQQLGPNNFCLDYSNGPQTAIQSTSCRGTYEQMWQLLNVSPSPSRTPTKRPAARIQPSIRPIASPTLSPTKSFDISLPFIIRSVAYPGYCVYSRVSPSSVSALLLQFCSINSPLQKFYVNDLHLQLASDTSKCIDASKQSTVVMDICVANRNYQRYVYDVTNNVLMLAAPVTNSCLSTGMNVGSVLNIKSPCDYADSELWTLQNV